MQATPLFIGACAFASIAGIVSGAAIDTQPIQRGGIGMDSITRPAVDFASDDGLSDQDALPDHYAINTPDGRYDVAELSSRGIYAQDRYSWRDIQYTPRLETAYTAPATPDYAADSNLPASAPAASWEIDQSIEASAEPIAEPAVQQAAQPPAETPQGEARLINVDLALAQP